MRSCWHGGCFLGSDAQSAVLGGIELYKYRGHRGQGYGAANHRGQDNNKRVIAAPGLCGHCAYPAAALSDEQVNSDGSRGSRASDQD